MLIETLYNPYAIRVCAVALVELALALASGQLQERLGLRGLLSEVC